jgi:hypothetical protein
MKKKIHGSVKCDCGHKQVDHHNNAGFCHHKDHNHKECGCTWFHPNVKYVNRKKLNPTWVEQLEINF